MDVDVVIGVDIDMDSDIGTLKPLRAVRESNDLLGSMLALFGAHSSPCMGSILGEARGTQ